MLLNIILLASCFNAMDAVNIISQIILTLVSFYLSFFFSFFFTVCASFFLFTYYSLHSMKKAFAEYFLVILGYQFMFKMRL